MLTNVSHEEVSEQQIHLFNHQVSVPIDESFFKDTQLSSGESGLMDTDRNTGYLKTCPLQVGRVLAAIQDSCCKSLVYLLINIMR